MSVVRVYMSPELRDALTAWQRALRAFHCGPNELNRGERNAAHNTILSGVERAAYQRVAALLNDWDPEWTP